MTTLPDHHCPGCGTALQANPRYPWHFCGACLEQARDGAGRGLEFANASLSGGLLWRCQGAPDWQDAPGVRCLILGRPAWVTEARFGGIIAQPEGGERGGLRAPIKDLSRARQQR